MASLMTLDLAFLCLHKSLRRKGIGAWSLLFRYYISCIHAHNRIKLSIMLEDRG